MKLVREIYFISDILNLFLKSNLKLKSITCRHKQETLPNHKAFCVILCQSIFKLSFTLHSSFYREKTVNEFPLGLWICFWDYGWLLSWPRWKFLPWKYPNQVALQSFFQKVVKIKNEKKFYCKKTFVTSNFWCRNLFWIYYFSFLNY